MSLESEVAEVKARRQRRAAWISFFVRAAAAKEAGQNVPDKGLSAKLVQQAENSITDAMDEYCGNGKNSVRHPGPGPRPGLNSLVNQLVILSNAFPAGAMRTELSSIAGRLLLKGIQSVPSHSAKAASA